VLARFAGTGRRFEVHELPGGRTLVDDYGHHPAEVAATIAAARERFPGRTVRVLFQPHLYSRTRHLAAEFATALAAADDVTVTDVYPARERPLPGVTGKLIVDALSDRGVLAGWTPAVEQGAERLRRRARDGDVLLVLGAGDVDRAVRMIEP
jgi:UDP-N-acetylmuramate--alanine ligase